MIQHSGLWSPMEVIPTFYPFKLLKYKQPKGLEKLSTKII